MRDKLTTIPTLARREFLRVGATTFVGFHLLPMLKPLQVKAEHKVSPRGSAEFCIFLFLEGGPPQLDTFDVKEGKWTPPDFDIRTITPDIKMPYGQFPKLSERIHHLALARSVEAWGERTREGPILHFRSGGPLAPRGLARFRRSAQSWPTSFRIARSREIFSRLSWL